MLRNLLSLSNDRMGGLVGVLSRPSALSSIRPGGFRFGAGFNAPKESADIDFFSTVRAVHTPKINPTVAYASPISK